MIYMVVPVSDVLMYERCFSANPVLAEPDTTIVPVLLENTDQPTSALLNRQIQAILPACTTTDWFMLCPEYMRFCGSPTALLKTAATNAAYGVFGSRKVQNLSGKYFYDFTGQVVVLPNPSQRICVGNYSAEPQKVDTLGLSCIAMHSSLVAKIPALGTRNGGIPATNATVANGTTGVFTEDFEHALYIEDLCLELYQNNIEAFTLPFSVELYTTADLSFPTKLQGQAISGSDSGTPPTTDEQKFLARHPEFSTKIQVIMPYTSSSAVSTTRYRHEVEPDNPFLPSALVAPQIKPGSKLLDAGCSFGDVGVFFKKLCGAKVWGMEYDGDAVKSIKDEGQYEDAFQVDLNNFKLEDFSRFYKFFNFIYLGDLLEHLVEPQVLLQKFKTLLTLGGSIITSVPNVGHAGVIGALLDHSFPYFDKGILDRTHLRFYTHKSQAELFASCGLSIISSTSTFLGITNFNYMRRPKSLPYSFYKYMTENKHFWAMQYACTLVPSNQSYEQLSADNLKCLEQSVEHNTKGWEHATKHINMWQDDVLKAKGEPFTQGEVAEIQSLLQENKIFDAVISSGLIDPLWYIAGNPDIAHTLQAPFWLKGINKEEESKKMHVAEHYITIGWKEGRKPSEYFDDAYYLECFPEATASGISPLEHYLRHNLHLNCRTRPDTSYEGEIALEYVQNYNELKQEHPETAGFVEYHEPLAHSPRLLAHYYPYFCPNSAFDRVMGKGYTGWSSTTAATPLYAGHAQPQLPAELGFYDQRLPETLKRQAALAKNYGIHGFCMHYRSYKGSMLQDAPLRLLLEHTEIDLPFCMAWDNAPLTCTKNGQETVLIKQEPTLDPLNLFEEIKPFIADKRYIQVNKCPVFILGSPHLYAQEHLNQQLNLLQKLAQQAGFAGLHIILTKEIGSFEKDAHEYGASAWLNHPPLHLPKQFFDAARSPRYFLNRACTANIYDYSLTAELCKQFSINADNTTPSPTYHCVLPTMDNSPITGDKAGCILENTNPQAYQNWLEEALQSLKQNPAGHDLLFVSSWNNWPQGDNLEPNNRRGYAWLDATRKALENSK